MTKFKKRAILVVFDALMIIIASTMALFFLLPYVSVPTAEFWLAIIMSVLIYYTFAAMYRLYDKINRYTSIRETFLHMMGITTAFSIASLITIPFVEAVSLRFMVLTYLFTVTAIPGSRVLWRVFNEHLHKKALLKENDIHKVRTLIVGAGDGGSLFVRSFRSEERRVGKECRR